MMAIRVKYGSPRYAENAGPCEKKADSCVIVKDFSRFSRDHIEQGKYIEQIFPFMGVRFIAINDNYDSADYVGGIGEIDVAFKGILYDFFSEEQSSKVSLTLDTKRGNGKYIATYAPYGYVKIRRTSISWLWMSLPVRL